VIITSVVRRLVILACLASLLIGAGVMALASTASAATGDLLVREENSAGQILEIQDFAFAGGGGCQQLDKPAGETKAEADNLTDKTVTFWTGSNCTGTSSPLAAGALDAMAIVPGSFSIDSGL
jgi:hypothetical protein